MDRPHLLRIPVDLDPLAAARGLSRTPGTLFLDGQRAWEAPARSALLFDPVDRFEPRRPAQIADLASRLPRIPGARFLGWAGWLGYDLGPARWDVRHPAAPPFEVGDGWLGLYETALVWSGSGPPDLLVADLRDRGAAADLPERAAAALDRLRAAASHVPTSTPATTGPPRLPDPAWHRRSVDRIHRYLRAGDAYQINLTGFASAPTTRDPWAVFTAERERNPVPFAAYLHTGSYTLTSHSPERLLRQRGRAVETAPIKGTAPADAGAALLASDKDRAEHVMIVDLARHDLGRSCTFGSVHVDPLFQPLALRGLTHLVSRVHGTLRPGAEAALWEDLFPGGSITGAPKRRAMEIITELERSRRGPYTGAIGTIDATGAADWNIAIRTAVWQNDAVHFGTGGGIVLDSDPDREYEELRWKAASFLGSLTRPDPLAHAPAGAPR